MFFSCSVRVFLPIKRFLRQDGMEEMAEKEEKAPRVPPENRALLVRSS